MKLGFLWASMCERGGERAFVASGEADQAFGMCFEFLCADSALAFLGAQLAGAEQARDGRQSRGTKP